MQNAHHEKCLMVGIVLVQTDEATDQDARAMTMTITATMLACIAVTAAAYVMPRRNPDVPVLTTVEARDKMRMKLKIDKA